MFLAEFRRVETGCGCVCEPTVMGCERGGAVGVVRVRDDGDDEQRSGATQTRGRTRETRRRRRRLDSGAIVEHGVDEQLKRGLGALAIAREANSG
jgi:hypothetical protein